MYLYEKDGDKIKAYSMEPNWDKIIAYKKDHRIYIEMRKAETNIEKPIFENIVSNKYKKNVVEIPINEINKKTIKHYHQLVSDDYLLDIERYIQSKDNYYKQSPLVRIFEYITDKNLLVFKEYLLLTSDNYLVTSKIRYKSVMSHIISLPEALYLLELINRGKFDLASKFNISEQLDLYDISDKPVGQIDIEQGKVFNTLDVQTLLEETKTTQKILKMVK